MPERAADLRAEEPTRPRPTLGSRVYLPACCIAAVAVLLVGVGWTTHFGGATFTRSLTSLRVVLVGPATLGVIGVILVVERIFGPHSGGRCSPGAIAMTSSSRHST